MKFLTISRIFIICVLALLIAVASFAVSDYNKAKGECYPLKAEIGCSYKICMAAEYSSNNMREEAGICIMEELYKEVKGEMTE